jgi:hypothetical protein
MPDTPRFDPDLEWLDLVRPVGLVVAPSLLKELGLVPPLQTRADNAAAAELLAPEDEDGPALTDAWAFAEGILDWPAARVAGALGGPPLPADLCRVLPEYDTLLEPHWAMAGPDGGWQLLARIEAPGTKPDARGALAGWEATPHQRFERLLRETEISIGVLITDKELRIVHAPRGETSGWIAFPLRPLATVAGRPMLGGLKLVLDRFRLFNDAENRRLPALLRASREAQTNVSTTLAEQVVGALHELLRGLTAAEPRLIATLAEKQPQHLYEGLLAVLMRLVFILYAEDRDLIPSRTDEKARALYARGYSARGLYGKLLEDQARYPDTMAERRGAWGRLIALFRLIHAGERTGWIRARGGKLFDPDAFPFLEGRASAEEPPRIPGVTDGCVLRILDGLLCLKGERLSYRTLDVEQIGSVYETVMRFTVQLASGPVLAIRAGKHNRTPVFVDLAELAALRPDERLRRLKEGAQRGSLTDRQQRAIRTAEGVEGIAAALDGIIDERGSPGRRVLQAGTPILQPTAERRSTGSHYTPRSLTEPIVRHALEPAFERLGPYARPEDVLDLKLCDPAMGSGAFLVEACRALAARLMQAWARWPETRPRVPPDEDEELHARRLVAQRCLYGIDKNPMATDLAKLSLWLATLARDHEFTFLDHALKSGDSLVGLSRAQIAALHWDTAKPGLPLFRDLIRDRFAAALTGRAEIRDAPDDVERAIQETRYRRIERRLSDARLLGDAVIAAFFSADKPRAREAKRQEIESWLNEPAEAMWTKLRGLAAKLRQGERPIPPFHWEIEFPEVFARENPGFDVMVGNPPFAGKNTIISINHLQYLDWLRELHSGAHGNADIVAHFFRRAYGLLRENGCLDLLATNTIRQGDTRATGLRPIRQAGGTIYRAQRRTKWPGEAAVVVSIVHIAKGNLPGPYRLDEREVPVITAFLFHDGGDDDPQPLRANANKSFIGSYVLGMGFTFDDSDKKGIASPISLMRELIAKDPRNAERIFPYIGGEEVNDSPTHAHYRWAINFEDFPRARDSNLPHWGECTEKQCNEMLHSGIVPTDYPGAVAADWPDLLRVLEYKVKPIRDNDNRESYRRYWWRFAERRGALYSATQGFDRVLAIARVGERAGFALLPAGMIYSEQLVVFAFSGLQPFAALQSRVHEVWARFFASSLEDRLRYTPTDCFETFPLPDGFETDPRLETVGREYYDFRAALMVERNEGPTKIYNRFHDPDERSNAIGELRRLHDAMDRAVLDAYGWSDIRPACGFELEWQDDESENGRRRKKPWRYRWPEPVRDEVLARLLALNAERAKAEQEADPSPHARAESAEPADLEEV